MLPSGKMPGGAPLNVGIHLKNFGHRVSMISRVGTDDLGYGLLDYISECGLETTYIQQGLTHLTGVVKVNLDDASNVSYKIVHPVAWDYIMPDPKATEAVKEADVFVFGSLAARSEQTFSTLKGLLPHAKLRVLDINLRPPWYSGDTLAYLLTHTDVLKMNHHELDEIAGLFFDRGTPAQNLETIAQAFELQMVCITLGENGALLYHKGSIYKSEGYRVQIRDTIGSGDSFLASLISDILEDVPLQEAIERACAVGALVAMHHGATPGVTASQIDALMKRT